MNIQVFPEVIHSGPHPDFKHHGDTERKATKWEDFQYSLCFSLVGADLTSHLEHLRADTASSGGETLGTIGMHHHRPAGGL